MSRPKKDDNWEVMLDGCEHKCVSCGEGGKLEKAHVFIPFREDGPHCVANEQPMHHRCNLEETKKNPIHELRPERWKDWYGAPGTPLRDKIDADYEALEEEAGCPNTPIKQGDVQTPSKTAQRAQKAGRTRWHGSLSQVLSQHVLKRFHERIALMPKPVPRGLFPREEQPFLNLVEQDGEDDVFASLEHLIQFLESDEGKALRVSFRPYDEFLSSGYAKYAKLRDLQREDERRRAEVERRMKEQQPKPHVVTPEEQRERDMEMIRAVLSLPRDPKEDFGAAYLIGRNHEKETIAFIDAVANGEMPDGALEKSRKIWREYHRKRDDCLFAWRSRLWRLEKELPKEEYRRHINILKQQKIPYSLLESTTRIIVDAEIRKDKRERPEMYQEDEPEGTSEQTELDDGELPF